MKEPLIMIPGTLCDSALFNAQVSGLQDLADCQIGNHSSSDNLQEVAANIINSVSGNFSVLGLSYGGIIAFEILRQAPQRIKRLILLNTNHKEPSEITRATQQRFLGMSVLGEFREITTNFTTDAMLHPKHAANPKMREAVLQMAENIGQQRFFNQIKAQLGRPDSTPDLPNIQCPTLIMTGREDNVCPIPQHQEMARLIPNSTFQVIEESGHLSTMEQPERVNELIRNWWINTKS